MDDLRDIGDREPIDWDRIKEELEKSGLVAVEIDSWNRLMMRGDVIPDDSVTYEDLVEKLMARDRVTGALDGFVGEKSTLAAAMAWVDYQIASREYDDAFEEYMAARRYG